MGNLTHVPDGRPGTPMRVTAYDWGFRTVATRVDPERAHKMAFGAIRAAKPALRRYGDRVRRQAEPVRAMGLTFRGPLGLAAGFDKNAEGVAALAGLGFGHVEVGTVTGEPQPGNPQPRLFRLPDDRAIVNRMGFNNDGAEAVAQRLARHGHRPRGTHATRHRSDQSDVVVGVNIGKTKLVPEERAVQDYAKSARLLAPYADYLVVNVSSPNTPGLRDLQAVDKLRPILEGVCRSSEGSANRRVPVLVKIAPDLADDDVLAVADLVLDLRLAGIVATNTTISREGLASGRRDVDAVGAGGLSGAPVRARADEVMRLLRRRVGPDLTLVGVGGIATAEDARARLAAGATLLQAYTGFVYGGPAWPARIQRALSVMVPTGSSTGGGSPASETTRERA